MITLSAGTRILLATKPVDFRKGAHSLAALAAAELDADPFSGAVLIFRSKRADRVKISVWDGSGPVLIWKQLEANSFRWPPIIDGVLRLTAVAFAAAGDPPRRSPGEERAAGRGAVHLARGAARPPAGR